MALCTDCQLHEFCSTNKMRGVGPKNAEIMVVGDAVGRTDDEVGRPFKGDGGQKLNYLLKKAGLSRKSLYLTHALKCKPNSTSQIKSAHVAACRKHLFREVLRIKPKVIVACGGKALESLLGEKSTRDFRGFFMPFELDTGEEKPFKTRIVPTYSMMAALMNWAYDDLIVHDFKKAIEFSKTGQLPKPLKVKPILVKSLKLLKQAEKELLSAEKIVFDFETTGLKFYEHEIVMAGYASKKGEVWCFPFRKYDLEVEGKKWPADQKELGKKINTFLEKHAKAVRQVLKKINASPIPKTAFNGKFDTKFAKANGIPVRNFKHDPIIKHSLVDENKAHSLTFNLEWYGINHLGEDQKPYDIELWPWVNKTKQSKKPYSYIPPQVCATYLAKDVDGTLRLDTILTKKVKQEKLWDLYSNQQMPLVRLMTDVEYRGIKLDVKQLQKVSKIFAGRLQKISIQLDKTTGLKNFNANSPKQIGEWLRSVDAPLIKKTPNGDYSTDENVMNQLIRSKDFRKHKKVPKLILEYRQINKLKSTYMDGKDNTSGMLSWMDKNQMVHCSSNIHTPRTGRMSIEDPALHQVPRPNPKYPEANLRSLFIPSRKDWVIASIDYKQIEMRVAAVLAKEITMIKEFQSGVDLHSRNMILFGKRLGLLPVDITEEQFIAARKYEAPKNYEKRFKGKKLRIIEDKIQLAREYDELRTRAKTIGFGVNYGLTVPTLAEQFGMLEEDVEVMVRIYFQKYNRLAFWRDDIKREVIQKGLLVLPETGRKRRFQGASEWFNSKYSKDCQRLQLDIEAVERQGMNFPIQGFANEVFTQGKLLTMKHVKKNKMKSRILISMHDGTLWEGPKEEMNDLRELCRKYMERDLGEGKYKVHLGVDFEVYDRWAGKRVAI